jgi:chromosome partitioning protein
MAGKVIAAANRKGGVGKTTFTVTLARTLASFKGRRVIVVDTDPQASASLALATSAVLTGPEHGYLEDYLQAKIPKNAESGFISQPVRVAAQHAGRLDLAPCSPKLWELEADITRMDGAWKRNSRKVITRFRALIGAFLERYDYVLIDTPPGRGLLTTPVLGVANLIVIPCTPDRISTWGLDKFSDELSRIDGSRDARRKARIIWTLYDAAAKGPEHFKNIYVQQGVLSAFREDLRNHADIARGAVQPGYLSFEQCFTKETADKLVRIADEVIYYLNEADQKRRFG